MLTYYEAKSQQLESPVRGRLGQPIVKVTDGNKDTKCIERGLGGEDEKCNAKADLA